MFIVWLLPGVWLPRFLSVVAVLLGVLLTWLSS
jgi:hypothetical protein